MPYEILPHTADVGVAATAGSAAELFSECARGMAEILLDAPPPAPTGRVPVSVTADDLAALLASFLDECLYVFETEGMVVVAARVRIRGETSCDGEALVCEGLEAAGPLIKAVTYHQLRAEKVGDRWEATVYFDV